MMRPFISILLGSLLLPAFGCRPPETSPPSLLLHNGKIFTGDPERPWAQAIAINGRRIRAIGSDEEVVPLGSDETQTVDLEQRLVIPGINDAHTHAGPWPEVIPLTLGDSATPDPSPEEVLAALEEAVEEAPDEQWIMGTIGPTLLDSGQVDRHALDKVTPDHPVMLESFTGHGLILNTVALQHLQIPVNVSDPLGGWYDRDAAGLINGVVWEYAAVTAKRRLATAQGQGAAVTAFQRLQNELFRWGITSIQHMGDSVSLEDTVTILQKAQISMRCGILRWPLPQEKISEAWIDRFPGLDALSGVRLVGIKWMLDGTPIERGAYLRELYADREEWFGRLNFSEEQIREILQGALDRNEQPALHASGDGTVELILRTMEELANAEAWRPRRVRIEHADGLTADLITQARALGVVVVQNPLHFSTGEMLRTRLGEERMADFQRLKTLLNAGIPVALGADTTGPGRNPYLNMMLAARHPANPQEAITLEEALVAYTSGSAYAERQETEKGMLTEGLLADLAVLSQDIFEVPLAQVPDTESVLTIVGGEIVYRTSDFSGSN